MIQKHIRLITYGQLLTLSKKKEKKSYGHRLLSLSLFIVLLIGMVACNQDKKHQINLAGKWYFQMDSMNLGITQKWYNNRLPESLTLPGSMAENGKGDDITVNTRWTGQIVDRSWYTDKKYEKYRKKGNIKIPFWLQPVKHYLGAAWYQKDVIIPNNWESKYIELKLERPHWETQLWVDNQHVGLRNSLGTPHKYDLTKFLKPGKHTISIRIDNSIRDIDPGMNSHSISDHTQSNWNGIAGNISLTASAPITINKVKLYPDIHKKSVHIKAQVKNITKNKEQCTVEIEVNGPTSTAHNNIGTIIQMIEVSHEGTIELDFPMGESPKLWDEFAPNMYTMTIRIKSTHGIHEKNLTFGLREFKVQGTQFAVNGRPIFLRGTLECAIFPKTGYPSTDIKSWKRIINICKAHGLNHIRFHSWCPPQAAFDAADQLGVYLQIECGSWANSGSSVGDDKPIDKWLYQEAKRILDTYGNHPSFCMMAYGNEPAGNNQGKYLSKFIDHCKSIDSRHVYTGGAGWPYITNADYYNNAGPRIQGWGQGLKSIINSQAPQTLFDFSSWVEKTPMPYVSHEIGQWCVYPNFKEIKKYTGVLKARNFEIFQESLQTNHMGQLSNDFMIASGKLQALCYKADIEAALRTKGFAGFQLLDLHDFPGQGTALVGVLDPFWDEKGYITAQQYSRFCNSTVPLARFCKRIFLSDEPIKVPIEVAHFGPEKLTAVCPTWRILDKTGKEIKSGKLPTKNISLGNGIELGIINTSINTETPQKLTLEVQVSKFSNSWDIWVYPSKLKNIQEDFLITQKLDKKALLALENGGKVLLTPIKGSVKAKKGGDIGIGFSSIFWNTAWNRGQKPHTLGILCDPGHPALTDFPTEYHSNWQWWDAMSHSNAIVLDEFSSTLTPIVRVIDDWFTNRRLALIFEVKVGRGKLLISGVDLLTNQDQRPEAKQLLYSLKKYMCSDKFSPKHKVEAQQISNLFNK